MKIFLIFVLLLCALCCGAQDSVTCIPNTQLRKAIKAMETLKIMRLEVSVLRMNYDTLTQRLVIKDSIITNQAKEIDVSGKMIKNLQQQKTTGEKISKLNLQRSWHYEEKFRKQKGITYTVAGVTIGIGIIAFFLK